MEKNASADISLNVTGQTWLGHVEASGRSHVRLRLLPTETGVLPNLAIGVSINCTVGAETDRHYAEARVVKQLGATVWLRVPPIWSRTERRQSGRTSTAFEVMYKYAGGKGNALCVDVSAGGFRLRTTHIFAQRETITLEFKLPGDSTLIRTDGIVLRVGGIEGPGAGFEIGVKFVRMRPVDGARLAAFCHM